eukprot:2585968-Lingulodinium_polyedra.AAC.1
MPRGVFAYFQLTEFEDRHFRVDGESSEGDRSERDQRQGQQGREAGGDPGRSGQAPPKEGGDA